MRRLLGADCFARTIGTRSARRRPAAPAGPIGTGSLPGPMALPGDKVVASNRKARRDFSVLETVEAGLVLVGSEVKSLREGHVQLADAYARIADGEAWLEGVHIAPYAFAQGFGAHEPDRPRKLLLHN